MKQNILTRAKKRQAAALLQENRLAEAKELCERIFQSDRTDVETLVLLGTIYRRLGNYTIAVTHCRRALQLNPRHAEAHQELGAALQCQGQMEEALQHYQTAIRLKPDLAEAYYLLGNALRELGLLGQATGYYRTVLRLDANHVPTLCNLGGTLAALHQFEEAALLLNKANQLRPGTTPILCNMARILQLLGRPVEAEARCREALQRDPQAVDAMAMLAELLEKSSRLEEVRDLIERGLKIAPQHAALRLCAVRLARREGRHQDAISTAHAALSANPNADSRCELHYLLGQLYDHAGDTSRAFAHFTEANRITAAKCAGTGQEHNSYLRVVEKYREEFHAALSSLSGNVFPKESDSNPENPVFLVGFPRSGTTLLEQILDSHPQLQALDERPTVAVTRKAYERIVARRSEAATLLTASEISELRKTYFEEVDKYVKREPGRILVDKMPLNLVEAYLIWRVFPDAKFILMLRHPFDACLSCFMQNFALNQAMVAFTNLKDTAATYAAVMNLWQEYTKILPLYYHMIRYEDLVENMERETRRLLEFLGIAWSDTVLDHVEHAKRRGTISTPSYHQVTQPIYKSAKYRWKRYARQVEPIMETLQPFIDYFGYRDAAEP